MHIVILLLFSSPSNSTRGFCIRESWRNLSFLLKVVTFHVQVQCMLVVSLKLAFTNLWHDCQNLYVLSKKSNECTHRLDPNLNSHLKELETTASVWMKL